MRFSLIVLFTFCTGCTTLHFRSGGHVNALIGSKDGHSNVATLEGKKNYFLWGFIPESHIVWVDQEITNMGFLSGSNITVRQYQTFGNFMLTLVSFGMYIPKNYAITVHGLKAKHDP